MIPTFVACDIEDFCFPHVVAVVHLLGDSYHHFFDELS